MRELASNAILNMDGLVQVAHQQLLTLVSRPAETGIIMSRLATTETRCQATDAPANALLRTVSTLTVLALTM